MGWGYKDGNQMKAFLLHATRVGWFVSYTDYIAHTAALVQALTKIADWLERQAAKNDEDVKTCRFESLNEAYRADAKNYRAMAKHARAALDGQP